MHEVDPESLIADLDADQRAAVTTASRLVAVIAGAGSGKTRVLTRRVAHRIATGDAEPRHTLVLTFTREAAGELRRRLRTLGLREHVEAGTFHSVMLGVMRQRWHDTDRRALTVVADRRRLVRDALAQTGSASPRSVASALSEIEWAGARGISADDYRRAAREARRRPAGGPDAVATAFAAYETLKRSRGVIDFDDVLASVLAEAERDPAFGDVLRWRFRHVLVDEAQDLNPVQHRLVDLLRRGRDDLFLVGDPSQAIYGFNGADPRVLTEVDDTFPGVEIVRLPVNHRCTPQIVRAARHALESAGDLPDLRSARADGPGVSTRQAADEVDEAAWVAQQISRGDPSVVRSGQVAVLARTNAQLEALEHALSQAGLPVRRNANAAGSPIQQAVRLAGERTSASSLRGWAHDILDDLDVRDTAETSGSRADVAAVDAQRRVATAVLDFLRDRPRGDGADFRSWVATTNPFHDRSTSGVDILTFHASKGREWHTVFLTGVESGLVPHKSASTTAATAEEARLLYVAMTRASDSLTLSSAERRGGYARTPSAFISDLDATEPEHRPPPHHMIRTARVVSPIHRLREWRTDAARRARVLPVQLVSDHDLASIARSRPRTVGELVDVTSLGAITAERLAPEILAALDEAGAADSQP